MLYLFLRGLRENLSMIRRFSSGLATHSFIWNGAYFCFLVVAIVVCMVFF